MRRLLANLLFLFVGLPVAFSALLLVSVRPWALDRNTYKRFVEDDRLYAALQAPELASRAPATFELRPKGSSPLVLDGPSAVAAAQKDLPWPDIKSAASRSIDAAMDAAEGSSPGRRFVLDAKPLKVALAAKSPAAARDYFAALAAAKRQSPAPIGQAELAKVLGAAVGEIPDAVTVNPATLERNRPGLPPFARNMPIGVLSQGPQPITQALLNRMTARSVAIAALVIAGLGALGGTGLISRLSRAGKYLLIPSVVILALGAILAIPGGLILQNALPVEIRSMVEGSGGAQLRAYLASALGPIARSFFITGLVGASVGGVLASSRRFSEPKEIE